MSGGLTGGKSGTGNTMGNSWPLLFALPHDKGREGLGYLNINLVAPGNRLNFVAHCGEEQPQHKTVCWAPSDKTSLTRSDLKTQLLVTMPFLDHWPCEHRPKDFSYQGPRDDLDSAFPTVRFLIPHTLFLLVLGWVAN